MWLQVPNTEQLLADPAYESVALAYSRREDHQEIAKSISVSRREMAKKEEFYNGHN